MKIKWQNTALMQAKNYGPTNPKGDQMLTLAALLYKVEVADDRSVAAQIPNCSEPYGTDFDSHGMTCRLLGLAAKYPELITVLTTHDLSSVKIADISALITAIRLD